MLIDDITIEVKAGDGGSGYVAFDKNLGAKGPAGGSGGRGGDVIAEGISDLSALNKFRFKKVFAAEDGRDGRSQYRDGVGGKDLTLKVPVGTLIHNLTAKEDKEILKVGEKVLLAKGGRGGKGNFLFRSPRNTSPTQFQEGKPGENFTVRLELQLIADVGLIGLPNVGKSSLLNELTNAHSKVANYPFTTLEPNLGVYYDLILADIPGLIEGASTGKGLGDRFLRHVERSRVLFHLISAESETPEKDYKVIRKELGEHHKDLLKKPEYLFLSKADILDDAELQKELKSLKKINPSAVPISIHDWDSLEVVKRILNQIIKEKTVHS